MFCRRPIRAVTLLLARAALVARLVSLVALAALILTSNLLGHTAFVEEPTKEQAAKQKAVDEQAVRALIAQLGDDSFDKREAAHKRLAELGVPALELLARAAKEM